jgi:peptide-methionine (R)-S-oxide reductase
MAARKRSKIARKPSKPGAAMPRTEEEWRKKLTLEKYHILRERGTEPAGSGSLLREKRPGVFVCGGCGAPLFKSETKFESGTGWPSFYDAIPGAVTVKKDLSYGMVRDEVCCSRCGGHLGHVFDDGPRPTGKRYCMNSLALGFKEK